MKVIDVDGTVLDATFHVLPSDEGTISFVFESSGGNEGGPNPRNLQYRQGLNVLLERLKQSSAVISEIRVETERTRHLPAEQQRVLIPDRTFPIAMPTISDIDSFRQELSRYGRKVGQSSEKAKEGGGSSRRMRFFLTGVPLDPAELESLLGGMGSDANLDAVHNVVKIAAGRSRSGGQGFLLSQSTRKAIESHAVSLATSHYRALGWEVTDVGARESYDLHCVRGTDELFVEVKGTSTLGESVILTTNEVIQARR